MVRGIGVVRQLPAGTHEMARVTVGIALQVVLVLRLGLPEAARRYHLGNHSPGP